MTNNPDLRNMHNGFETDDQEFKVLDMIADADASGPEVWFVSLYTVFKANKKLGRRFQVLPTPRQLHPRKLEKFKMNIGVCSEISMSDTRSNCGRCCWANIAIVGPKEGGMPGTGIVLDSLSVPGT